MKPLLDDGDFVLALVIARRARVNRLLVVQHPEYGVIVKRVIGVNADGSCWLGSENASGVDTLKMGQISQEQVLGRVLWRIRR